MDMEQFKLLIEMLSGAGQGAKELITFYFIYLFADLVYWLAIVGGAFYGIYKLVSRLVTNTIFSAQVGRRFGMSEPLDYSEMQRILKWIDKAKELER